MDPERSLQGLHLGGDLTPRQLYQVTSTERTYGSLGASATIAPNDICMVVDGVVYPAKSAAAMGGLLDTLGSKIPGADADGGVLLYAARPAVKVQFLTGTSKTLGLDQVVYDGAELDVKIQLGTDGGGAVTSTGAAVAAFINNHGLLRSFGMKAAATGTGSGLAALAALTSIAVVGLAGWARVAAVNAGGSPVAQEMTFDLGVRQAAVSGTIGRAQVPSSVGIVNATNIRPVAGPLDLVAQLVNVDSSGAAFIEIH